MSSAEKASLSRIMIAGLSGDSGKTFLSLGIIRALKKRGFRVSAFKKGPDFIDAAWLGQAAGCPGRNLDTYLMPGEKILSSLAQASETSEVAVIEGNRGLFDGVDSSGSHSTAQLSKLTKTPVVLVVNTTKTTRTIAAMVLGCQHMDSALDIAGVVLNRVGTSRQESVVRKSIEETTGIPVVGSIPRVFEENLPSRHLGLVTAVEHPRTEEAIETTAEITEKHVDLNWIAKIAADSPDLEFRRLARSERKPVCKIGVLRDKAFSFYYPENLEALEAAGGQLVDLSPTKDDSMPSIDFLYAGGGFPEVHARTLAQNQAFKRSLRREIQLGLPVWAECGGLMYLSQAVETDDQTYSMTGALPVTTRQMPKPQGHGYVRALVDRENPFFEQGTYLFGHEFHYSRITGDSRPIETVLKLEKGIGIGKGRDGIAQGTVLATYTHLHALGTPQWAPSLIRVAERGNRS